MIVEEGGPFCEAKVGNFNCTLSLYECAPLAPPAPAQISINQIR